MQNSPTDETCLPLLNSGSSLSTVSASTDLTFVSASSSSQGKTSTVRWNGMTNIQNDQLLRCENILPRLQPSFLQLNDMPQPSLPDGESDIAKPGSSVNQQPREKRISFSLKQKRDNETQSASKSDAMEIDNAGNDRETSLLNRMEVLEEKIKKAACVELRYLQSLGEVTQKRMRWEDKQHEAISRRPRANNESASAVLESYISEAGEKIAKAIKIETAYKRRVKEFHDKRYRWSKLYENAGRELLELDPSWIIPPLPPLFTPSFLRR